MFKAHQDKDKELQNITNKAKLLQGISSYSIKAIEGVELIHFNNKIVVPKTLQERVMEWYHHHLCHPGETKMERSMNAIYFWQNMQKDIAKHVKTCDMCQRCKKSRNKQYGFVLVKHAELTKWNRVNLDCWGPKIIRNDEYEDPLRILTIVDPVTGWFEYAHFWKAPTADVIQQLFDSTWLAWYPRPREIGFDNGAEFKAEFLELAMNMGLKPKKSLPWNPQCNAILERIHQVLQNCLLTMDLDNVKINEDDNGSFEEYLSREAYAIRGG